MNTPGHHFCRPAATLLAILLLSLFSVAATTAHGQEFERNTLFDGLHITGSPVDIDAATYRLAVTGKVERELSLSFADIQDMEAVERRLLLECPGFFTDVGIWTGVPVRTILNLAGLHTDAKTIIFVSADNIYRTRFPVDYLLQSDDTLIAYRFEGRQFHRVHGFPVRLVAGGREGSDWVKWLGSIIVE
ncbi:molybdopterin-dependent oxidoreductase [Desulfofustis glycolicus]|uniref:molybdopterin-dependent oxidoreductase n=1 Tax=Desulfofustis glycolicus TaxID=51195 RepID=UPI00137B57C8|nr:molybdopterin-dependent oxidoreductase [Desulfofustis glycolicus]MCB2214986.1 molybdopterin-dependent oxidoreductase [Desulfobulbaceae bacterium]